MVHHLPITKARVNLGQVVRRVVRNRVVRNKEYFILEKDGIPVAGIMGADELEDYLELRDPKVKRAIQKSHLEYVADTSRPASEFLAELRRKTTGGSKRAAKRSRA
ncbi:MAG: hypothetical protein DMG57_30405 [Acidobacteria bacterium]|nr:MAG: hypothetical protein DMG57_30405 [Acidobacteriota bacterium]